MGGDKRYAGVTCKHTENHIRACVYYTGGIRIEPGVDDKRHSELGYRRKQGCHCTVVQRDADIIRVELYALYAGIL